MLAADLPGVSFVLMYSICSVMCYPVYVKNKRGKSQKTMWDFCHSDTQGRCFFVLLKALEGDIWKTQLQHVFPKMKSFALLVNWQTWVWTVSIGTNLLSFILFYFSLESSYSANFAERCFYCKITLQPELNLIFRHWCW